MAQEIERKYLIEKLPAGFKLPEGTRIYQGYLSSGDFTIRARIIGERSVMTIKFLSGQSTKTGVPIKNEFEYDIPYADAEEIISATPRKIEKVRYDLPGGIELDVFMGRHEGLILAEFESEDGSSIDPPEGVSWKEVTLDERYSNSWISLNGIPDH